MRQKWQKIQLVDKTSGGAVMLQPIKFHGVGVWVSTGLP
jgi:hypothetical protein